MKWFHCLKGYCSKDDVACNEEEDKSGILELLDDEGNVLGRHKLSDEALDNINKQKEAELKEQERLEEEDAQDQEKFKKM